MISKIKLGDRNDAIEVSFGSGDIMFHGLRFDERLDKYCIGFCQMEPRKIGEETGEFKGLNTDQLPSPVEVVFSFTKPESVTALIHSLIELQKRMFDVDQS
jgi:hypothetical protein